ncbi:hypothetical protein FACS189492_2610 [Clostridia bacterium]|nr:hypothetical protein FACS189492_2610 [Clostridia bacterium]
MYEWDACVTQSFAVGRVSGKNYVGGLVGSISQCANGGVYNSFSTGDVTGESYVGGALGYGSTPIDGGIIEDAYATGNVFGSGEYIGGFSGVIGGSCLRCYSTGAVVGNKFTGAFAGSISYMPKYETIRVYCNSTNNPALSELIGERNEITPLTTTEMQSSNFVDELNASFSSPLYYTWLPDITPPTNDGYPILAWQLDAIERPEPTPTPAPPRGGGGAGGVYTTPKPSPTATPTPTATPSPTTPPEHTPITASGFIFRLILWVLMR